MTETLTKLTMKKIVGPTSTGAAVFLASEEKALVVFVGFYEGTALVRELRGEETSRPLTHDLLWSVCLGFDLQVQRIVITEIIEGAFCATLVLEQKVTDEKGEWVGKRNEVRIDARPSDCFILAAKSGAEIYATESVISQVQDFSELLGHETEQASTHKDVVIEPQFPAFSPFAPGFESPFGFGLDLEGSDDDDEDDEDDPDDL